MPTATEYVRDVGLDALAVVAAASRNDAVSVAQMLNSYRVTGDADNLFFALSQITAGILDFACQVRECPPEAILAAVRAQAISEDAP